jgi:general secretion pathway protein G
MAFTQSSTLMRPTENSKRHGFTLIEVLVVISIIVLMAGLTISKVGSLFDSSKLDVAKLFVTQTMKTPLFAYQVHMGNYPTTEEGLQALITAPAARADRWRGPYIEGSTVPLDPWGEAYQYRFPGTHNKNGYDLWSKGPDRTDGAPDNIGNW